MSRTSSSSGAGSSPTAATVRLTVLAPASGTRSSRHQHSPGSWRWTSSTYGGSSTSTSPIHDVTISSASNAATGSSSITNDGTSCWTRSVHRPRRGRGPGPGPGPGVPGPGPGLGPGDAASCAEGADNGRRPLSWPTAASNAALSSRISSPLPPRSGWRSKAKRRRAARTSPSVASGGSPSAAKGSGSLTPIGHASLRAGYEPSLLRRPTNPASAPAQRP